MFREHSSTMGLSWARSKVAELQGASSSGVIKRAAGAKTNRVAVQFIHPQWSKLLGQRRPRVVHQVGRGGGGMKKSARSVLGDVGTAARTSSSFFLPNCGQTRFGAQALSASKGLNVQVQVGALGLMAADGDVAICLMHSRWL